MKYDAAGFRAGGSLKVYGEMMKSLDAGIGRVLAALRTTGLERNTLVIFTSDNGGERFSFNWPFTGQKMDVHEGGVRVPAIVMWPGVTRAGIVTDQPVITMDWTATMVAAAGGRPVPEYPMDGEDLTTFLSSKRPRFDRTFYWRTRRQGAVRSGNWKYVREGKTESLYDLSRDDHEQANFASSQPQILGDLRIRFDSWADAMQKYPNE
jgi:arylsulfatase A-like enzyme